MAITTSAKITPIPSPPPGADFLQIFIAGDPASQGSKNHVGNGVMVESSKKLKPWRQDVRARLTGRDGRPLAYFPSAVCLRLEFVLYRPRSLSKKKPTPPAIKRPDLDKMTRAIFDSITSAGVWKDDSQVTRANVSKRLAREGEPTGCHLLIMQG